MKVEEQSNHAKVVNEKPSQRKGKERKKERKKGVQEQEEEEEEEEKEEEKEDKKTHPCSTNARVASRRHVAAA